MEYQKITDLLGNVPNQPSKFRTKYWVEINNESRGTCNTGAQIEFKTTILKSSFFDDSDDAYILVKGNIRVNNTGTAAAPTNRNKKVICKNYGSFTHCISEINNTQVDNTKYIDIVMPMYNLIEYRVNFSKTPGSLWQYCKDIPAVDADGDIVNFNGANATDSFNFKAKIAGQMGNNGGIEDVEIMVPSKCLSNFRRTLEMPLINCEVNLIVTWSANCAIIYIDIANQNPTFVITETKLYNPVVTLPIHDNAKLLLQLKSSFK